MTIIRGPSKWEGREHRKKYVLNLFTFSAVATLLVLATKTSENGATMTSERVNMTAAYAALNTPEAEQARVDGAKEWRDYEHKDMANFFFLKLLLRVLTNDKLFDGDINPEPFTLDGKRQNGGCRENDPNCILIWDGWARAMATGDVLYGVLERNVPGAVVEVGVWKGGMAAYLQGMLMATGQAAKNREMWLVDSFKGMPPADRMESNNTQSQSKFNSKTEQENWPGKLSIGVQVVNNMLDRLGLMDAGNVHFLEGYIQDTLANWNVKQIAFLRIDVDIYAATFDALFFLYPRLQVGGAVLFDDWKFPYSRQAIADYRKEHGILTPVQFLPGCLDPMAFWIKE